MLRIFWSLSGRQKDIVDQPKGVLQHLGDDPTQQTAAYLQRRVGVYLTKPWFPPRIHQIVQPEQLKTNPAAISNQSIVAHCTAYVPSDPLDFGQNLAIEIESGVVEAVLIEIVIGEFVGRLELVIVGHVLLNGIICQMDTLGYLFGCEFLRGSANITLLVHVKLQGLVHLHS